MNPARRKILHILSNNKDNKQETEKVEVKKPVKEIVVELPKIEVPLEEVKEPVPEESVAVEGTEVQSEDTGEQAEAKRNLPPKQKKYKKDVEVGQ